MIATFAIFGTLLLARVGAFVALLPLLGGNPVPRTVKVGLTMALTVLWGFAFAEQLPACAALMDSDSQPWLRFGIAVGREVMLGAVVGYVLGLLMVPARIAGEVLSQEMGLSFGNMVSVSGQGSVGPLTTIFELLAGAVFLALDGHHGFFAVMHGVFEHHPVGVASAAMPLSGLLQGTMAAETWGLMLAAPVAVCLFLTTVVLTLLARATPQLNLYTVGFPLRLGVGLLAILVLLPHAVATLVSIFGHMGELTGWLLP